METQLEKMGKYEEAVVLYKRRDGVEKSLACDLTDVPSSSVSHLTDTVGEFISCSAVVPGISILWF